jgi:guanosine-3',5'-bis(diphosphate) 3'-pyrophosphohydrolase
MKLSELARLFATAAHHATGQLRKYTDEPYIVHPAEVVALVASVEHTEEMLAAAWLHDVVEDTKIPLSLIEKEFGPVVASLVEELTDVSKASDGNRAKRKAIDLAHTAQASPEGKTLKLSDLIANSATIVAYGGSFACVYLAEKAALLEVLRGGDAVLWERAKALLEKNLMELKSVPTRP